MEFRFERFGGGFLLLPILAVVWEDRFSFIAAWGQWAAVAERREK
jgi:hypothetical protein